MHVDNTTAIACIKKGGSTKSDPCNDMTRQIHELCVDLQLIISVVYINTKDNIHADEASRAYTDSGEWSLSDHTYTRIAQELGVPDIEVV